jgi:hypothetical protein
MKPRDVIITQRVITDAPLSALRQMRAYDFETICGTTRERRWYTVEVLSAEAHVVEPWEEAHHE